MSRHGRRHSKGRDAAAISHHYDVGNDFYALVLGPSMVYSCAVWESEKTGLDAAQEAKLDLVCRKLGLEAGHARAGRGLRLGKLRPACRAALRGRRRRRHTFRRTGGLARKRAADAGLTDRVEIRVQDYRDVDDGPFDAISSIGMSEHVGREQIGHYASRLQGLLRPGGRLLNHAISWNAGPTAPDPDSFIPRYVFPDGEMLSLSDMVAALEAGGPGSPRRRGAAPALCPDAPGLGAEPGGALGRGRPLPPAWTRPDLAALHGRQRARLRGAASPA